VGGLTSRWSWSGGTATENGSALEDKRERYNSRRGGLALWKNPRTGAMMSALPCEPPAGRAKRLQCPARHAWKPPAHPVTAKP
jgi:hypothetical protein